jgi:folate-binding protein YgfZ
VHDRHDHDPVASPRGYAALVERAGVAAAPAADFLDLVGPDAGRFLNGYVTCDTRALAAGHHARGFLTSLQGRVLAELEVAALPDRLRLRLPADAGAAVRAHLQKYRIADRVEFELPHGVARLILAGPAAPAALAAAGVDPPAAGRGSQASVAGQELLVLRQERAVAPRFELWLAGTALPGVEAVLFAAGAEAAEPEALEILRVEAGELAFGVDFGPDNFPQESGDAAAVSYTKGCYLGQEVVARLRWRGQAQRLPFGLRFAGGTPAPGAVMLYDGRPAGRATSVVRSPRYGAIGLALLHRRVGEPPARLELEGGGTAELVPLPFS